MLVQTFVAQVTTERFDEGVLLRLTRRNVMPPLDADVLALGEHCVTGPFGSVVTDDHARQPATRGDGDALTLDTPP
ncbi:hypothetical protein FBR43_14660 [Sphingomonas baiyangensis]|uniref:Uncharacterized protein n=1 Tax=Sphingomonas baiyangensis TaxID=2572576 RepID=A0A4U1L6F0_9SPHN|nr:hypothetical protein FBR43_14660 [Sphingomonas baiyangensis]